MFNSSLRRVARTCTNGSPVPSRPATPSIGSITSHAHQRRHSSSKPPVPPNNGSSAIPASSVKQVGAPRSEGKKPGGESRLSKRKVAKDRVEGKQQRQDDWTSKLPSVPSLQHLNPKDVYVASFFSTHRPISITGPLPPETQLEDIEKIFQPKAKSRSRTGPAEVIYTISAAVEHLDEQIANKQAGQQDQSVAQKAEIIRALTQHNDNVANPADSSHAHHLDGAPPPTQIRIPAGNLKLVVQEIARRFRPFNVPPAPIPVSDAEIAARDTEAAAAEANEELQAQELEIQIENQDADAYIQQVVLNVREKADLQNDGFFIGQGVPVPAARAQEVANPAPGPRAGGRQRRGLLRRKPSVYAISVKRQRRLKMKKHKYKKLMRKTRNLRRRQDKL